jgi:hypothetical protein
MDNPGDHDAELVARAAVSSSPSSPDTGIMHQEPLEGCSVRNPEIVPNHFSVADLLSWQRDGTLDLNPAFQRRSVWKRGAKGYLIDTVARGLPIPLLFLRERVDLHKRKVVREVVDGQQRLRNLFAFVEPAVLADFDPDRDRVVVSRTQNRSLGGRTFEQLTAEQQSDILGYKFSVQILPTAMEDRDILEIFARINSTGLKVNAQELRNAAWFGEFKTLMYELAYEQFERWRAWRVLTDDQLSRMIEVELTSDLVLNMIDGLSGRSQARLNKIYERFDEQFPARAEIARRFRMTMEAIDSVLGKDVATTIYRSEIHFFTLFVFFYDRMWGLKSALTKHAPAKLPQAIRESLIRIDASYREQTAPKRVLDAVARASTDLGRRRTRLDYMAKICGG